MKTLILTARFDGASRRRAESMRAMSAIFFAALNALIAPSPVTAKTVIDFEDQPPFTIINNQYGSKGVVFQGAFVATDLGGRSGTRALRSIPPNTEVFEPVPLVITFTSPQECVTLFANSPGMARNGTLQAFGANGRLIVEDSKQVAADAFTAQFKVISPTRAIRKVVLQLENAAHYAIDDLEVHSEPPAGPDTLDKTDCCGVVLDDAMFTEAIVRDQRDHSYGALSNSKLHPLGGGEGYDRIVPRPETVVRTAGELRAALRASVRSAQTIYVDDASDIDLSYCATTPTPPECREPRSGPPKYQCSDYSLVVPANTTLASGRGRAGSRGARLFSRTFTECPLLEVKGENVRITGLRIHGPDSSIENDEPIHCGGDARGIMINTSDAPVRWVTEIDNNELSSWPRAGVEISRIMGLRVHHNVIQFNRRQEHNGTCGEHPYGLGYGVVLGAGSATIEANVFDHNRHDIASDGMPGSHYTATYNLVLTGAVEHSFDVHGGKSSRRSGDEVRVIGDRPDCTNIAGSAFVVHHNTFLQAHKPAVRIRGIPLRGAWIYKNETRDDDPDDAFTQVNSKGNFHVKDNRTEIDKFPAWFISFGGSTFWQWRRFDAQGMSASAAGDFDGDGAADVMRATSTGWQWSKGGREGWAFLNTITQPVSQLAFGDFVGLATTDIIRATGAKWEVSQGGTSMWTTLLATRAPLSSAAFGDFEGDGKTDAFFADGTQWSIVHSYSPRTIRHYTQPYKLSELRFGNFVGDSKIDVLRSTGSEWLVWDRLSKSWNHLGFSSIPLAQLTFADFDGDSRTDIARSANGQWLVSWGGASAWQVLNASSLALKSQLIADFNGDHKADVLSRQSPDP